MIKTSRLLIRPFTVKDAPGFYQLAQDDGFNLFPITVYRQGSVQSAREWILSNPHKFAVREQQTDALIGMGGLTPWQWEGENLVDLTYRLRTSAWGKGYGLELALALVENGFKTLKLPVITVTITPDNEASKKIAEKLGMKFDRRIELYGVPTDLYRLSKLT